MKSTFASLSIAALMATTAIGPMAQAQTPPAAYAQDQETYRQQQSQYQAAQARYQDQQGDYAARDAAYRQQRHTYEHARDDYDAAHGAGAFVTYYTAHPRQYDRVYGPGAYVRDFGQPVGYNRDRFDSSRRDYDRVHGDGAFLAYYVNHPGEYDARFGPGAYARDFGQPVAYNRDSVESARHAYDRMHGEGSFQAYYVDHPGEYDSRFGPGAYAQDYGRPVAYEGEDCHQKKQDHAVVGGVLGAVAGAVVGSNVASGGGRLGGSIIGGVLGAGAGSAIAKHSTHCD